MNSVHAYVEQRRHGVGCLQGLLWIHGLLLQRALPTTGQNCCDRSKMLDRAPYLKVMRLQYGKTCCFVGRDFRASVRVYALRVIRILFGPTRVDLVTSFVSVALSIWKYHATN